jgi:hypothetical protein
MGWGAMKTVVTAVALCLAAGAVGSVALAGCGGEAKPTSDEVDAGYLRIAKHAREHTFTIDRATENPPGRPGQIAREFRSFAGGVDYTATYLLTVSDLGPVGLRAFVLSHSLTIYEATLRGLVKRARRGDRSLTRDFRGVRQAGAEVRASAAAWERVLRAAIADR